MKMSDIFKKRMALHGETVSDSMRIQSDELMNKTFTNDLGYRKCKLYSRTMELLEPSIDIKYQYSQVYTLNKDQVEYLAQFRPGYHPEKKYVDSDGVERLGFYIEIPDKNTGVNEMWLILGKNDKNNFIRYNILKCNWTFRWIKDGIVYSCLGIIRNRNNYNSGVWSDGFFTSVDNQAQFILPTTPETETIDYNDRFMLSDSKIRPLVYEITKIEDAFPCGSTKFTLKQDHYNASIDNSDLKICNYYSSPILPEENLPQTFILEQSGTNPTLRVGGSPRTITLKSENEISVNWKYSFDGIINLTKEELNDSFIIEEYENYIIISAIKNYENLGKVITITAYTDDYEDYISMEVRR